jgi:transposase
MGELIQMSKKEIARIPVLERLKTGEIHHRHARQLLGVSKRQSQRLKKRYASQGVAGLAHKGRGGPSNRQIKKEVIEAALKIIKESYKDFGPTLAYEKLKEKGQITFGLEVLRRSMIAAGLWKAKQKRGDYLHQARERRDCFGELIQVDGSLHKWFEERGPMCTLLAYIDDATSSVVYAEFVKSESTWSYFEATQRYFKRLGKPLALYTDKHSVFRVNVSKEGQSATTDSNGDTQFSRALKSLDVDIIYAHSPQAKGRVERLYKTLQDRLVKELRLANICTIDDANIFLPKYLAGHNARFAIDPKDFTNLHRPLTTDDNLDQVFLLQETRILSKTLTCQYKNKAYQVHTKKATYRLSHATITVSEARNGDVSLYYEGQPLAYTVIETKPKNKDSDSKNLNAIVDEIKSKTIRNATQKQTVTPKIPYKPPADHPWRAYRQLSQNLSQAA